MLKLWRRLLKPTTTAAANAAQDIFGSFREILLIPSYFNNLLVCVFMFACFFLLMQAPHVHTRISHVLQHVSCSFTSYFYPFSTKRSSLILFSSSSGLTLSLAVHKAGRDLGLSPSLPVCADPTLHNLAISWPVLSVFVFGLTLPSSPCSPCVKIHLSNLARTLLSSPPLKL